MPTDDAKVLTDLFVEVIDGRTAHVTDGVLRALSPPREFHDHVRNTAATGTWETPP
jgi:hypothetical protein